MARVHRHRAVSSGPVARHRALAKREKPSYKVVLEQVTQEKKKLITVVSFEAKPPAGYTFIPAGDPQLTNRCKQLAREDGAKVLIVSTTPHKHRENLSHEVHRIGYHFPSSVVGRACMSLGVDLTPSGHVIRNRMNVPLGREDEEIITANKGFSLNVELSQATIDTQAREAIKDLFPKIPSKDLRDIIIRAFEKGKSRVGTAAELSLPRRVQLAVVAHIRHNYTNYDSLLRRVPYQIARARVEQISLDKLAQWRGDDDDEPNAMEDILREVIVIPDDDEESEDKTPSRTHAIADREGSVEIVSSHAFANDLQTHQIDYASDSRDAVASRPGTPNSEGLEEFRFLGHGQYAFDSHHRQTQARNERFGYHRQRAWEQALRRRRNMENPQNLGETVLVQQIISPSSATMNRSNLRPQESSSEPSHGPYRDPRIQPVAPVYLRKVSPVSEHLTSAYRYSFDQETPASNSVLIERTSRQNPVPRNTSSSKIAEGHNYENWMLPFEDCNQHNIVFSKVPRSSHPLDEATDARRWQPRSNRYLQDRLETVIPSIEPSPRLHEYQSERPRLDSDPETKGSRYSNIPQSPIDEMPYYYTLPSTDNDNEGNVHYVKRRRILGNDTHNSKNPQDTQVEPHPHNSIFVPVEHDNHRHFQAHRTSSVFYENSSRISTVNRPAPHQSMSQPKSQVQSTVAPPVTFELENPRFNVLIPSYEESVQAVSHRGSTLVSSRPLQSRILPNSTPHYYPRHLSATDDSSMSVSVPHDTQAQTSGLLHEAYVSSRAATDEWNHDSPKRLVPLRELRTVRPSFGEASEPLDHRVVHLSKPRFEYPSNTCLVYGSLEGGQNSFVESSRPRTYLPLESSFTPSRPMLPRSQVAYRDVVRKDEASDTGDQFPRAIQNSPHPQQVVLRRARVRDQEEFRAHPTMRSLNETLSVQHQGHPNVRWPSGHRRPDLLTYDDHQNPLSVRVAEEFYERLPPHSYPTHENEDWRSITRGTGQEVIVLE